MFVAVSTSRYRDVSRRSGSSVFCFFELPSALADAVADQTDPNPGLATAEQGEEWFERVTERLAKFVGEVIDGERQSEAPPFHP